MSGNQIAMVLGTVLILVGIPFGQVLLALGVSVWLVFALLALARQF